jgi:hypothetical protein
MAFEGNALTFTHSGLSNQTSYGYRVCAIDRVGNVGVGVTALVQPRAEFNAPTGSVVINDGAAFTGSIAVTVAITATDASGIAFMCLSNTTAACTAFVPFSATTSFSLTNASGVRTVYVTLKDTLGNVTTAPLTDTITLDVTAPIFTSISVVAQPGGLSFAWAAADAGMGVAGYRLVIKPGTVAPAVKCTDGTPLVDGLVTSFVDPPRPTGSYTYRLCARDAAGNVSDGQVIAVSVR